MNRKDKWYCWQVLSQFSQVFFFQHCLYSLCLIFSSFLSLLIIYCSISPPCESIIHTEIVVLMDLNIYLLHKDETSTVYSPCYTSALFISRAQTLLECGCSAPHRFWAVPVLSPVAFFELVEHKEDVGSLNSAVVSLWPLIRPCFSLYFLYSLHGRILPLFL